MKLWELRGMLEERQRKAWDVSDLTVELRHDNELMVFNQRGMMVGEPIMLTRGPGRDVESD